MARTDGEIQLQNTVRFCVADDLGKGAAAAQSPLRWVVALVDKAMGKDKALSSPGGEAPLSKFAQLSTPAVGNRQSRR